MEGTTKNEIPQEGAAKSGESLLPITGSSSKDSGGSKNAVKGKKKSPKRAERDAARAAAFEDMRRKREEDVTAQPTEAGPSSPSLNEALPNYTWARRVWIRGSTLFRRKKKEKKEGEGGASEEDPEPPQEEGSASVDPSDIYRGLDESCKLARIEEPRILRMVLRRVVRHRHPKGEQIVWPAADGEDIVLLSCVNLPTDPEELEGLLEKVYQRRGHKLDKESLYRDYCRLYGAILFDASKPFPECYVYVRRP